jgi:hypothetical protein
MTDDVARKYQLFLRQPMFSMLGLFVAWQVFNPLVQPVYSVALNVLYPGLYR